VNDKRLQCILIVLKRDELTLKEKHGNNDFVLPDFPRNNSIFSYALIDSQR
jgi:hypothetical protein